MHSYAHRILYTTRFTIQQNTNVSFSADKSTLFSSKCVYEQWMSEQNTKHKTAEVYALRIHSKRHKLWSEQSGIGGMRSVVRSIDKTNKTQLLHKFYIEWETNEVFIAEIDTILTFMTSQQHRQRLTKRLLLYLINWIAHRGRTSDTRRSPYCKMKSV